MSHQSPYASFCEQLRGLQIYDRKSGNEIYKWQIFNNHSWLQIAQQIKSGTHEKYSFRVKENVSNKLLNRLELSEEI